MSVRKDLLSNLWDKIIKKKWNSKKYGMINSQSKIKIKRIG
ncbi:hypothetical protein JCM13304A_15470 [Desulfothermus okinawensis JCM 13304]